MESEDSNQSRVISSAQSTSKKSRRKKLLLTAGLLIVIIVVSGVVAKIVIDRRNAKKASQIATTKLSDENVNSAVNTLIAQKKYDEARQLIANSSSNSVSKESLEQLANISYNSGEYTRAKQEWQAIGTKFGIDSNIAINAAQSAEMAGDKQSAITYYGFAVDKLKSEDYPGVRDDLKYYQAKLNDLKK